MLYLLCVLCAAVAAAAWGCGPVPPLLAVAAAAAAVAVWGSEELATGKVVETMVHSPVVVTAEEFAKINGTTSTQPACHRRF